MAKSKSGISVTHIGKVSSDFEFRVIWPNGTKERYTITPYLGGKYLAQLRKGAVGRVANLLKKHGRKISEEVAMGSAAEKLIDQYLEEKDDKFPAYGKGTFGKPASSDGNKGKPATDFKPDGTSPHNKVS